MSTRSFLTIAIATSAICAFSSQPNAQVLLQKNLSIHMALTIAQTALEACTTRVSVAVVDRAGRIKVFLQGDDASPHNIELARRKAYTALTFRRTSLEWTKRTETQNQGQRMLTDVITQQGGVPILAGGEIIGAVGLSGAPNGGQQEEDCGKAGIAKVSDELK
jgi:uncharacterized protein GlcG (DUF336 family)